MSDDRAAGNGDDGAGDAFEAGRCPNGHLSYPPHPRCPDCGEPQDAGSVPLADRAATVVTWTTSTATPPGVREPNHLAIVEFDVDGEPVRALGQLTTAENVEIGTEVRPVAADDLRDPDAGIRWPESQSWHGYRFRPME